MGKISGAFDFFSKKNTCFYIRLLVKFRRYRARFVKALTTNTQRRLSMPSSQGPSKRQRRGVTRRSDVMRRNRLKKRNRMVTVPRNRMAFPQSQRATLRYVNHVDMTPTGSNVQQFAFRANSLNDPEYPLGGHQARGFDEYMGIYKTYTVLGCTLSVNWVFEGYAGPTNFDVPSQQLHQTMANQASVAASPVICGIHKGLEVLSAGEASVQMEKDRTTWAVMLPVGPSLTQSSSLKIADFFGKQALVGAEGFTGDDSTNPVNQVLFEIWCGLASSNTGGRTVCRAYCTLQFDAVFTEPLTLNAS